MDQAILDLLESTIRDAGRNLGDGAQELRTYSAGIMAQLALGVGEAGFEDAAVAARDAIALKAGILLTDVADAADARTVNFIQGLLVLGATSLAESDQ